MPTSVDITLAERQMNLGNPRGAIAPLRRALAEDPDDALAHAYLAFCLGTIGQYWKSEYEAQNALTLAPDNPSVQFAVGLLELLHKDYEAAEHHLKEARRRAPWDARCYRFLARLFRVTGRPDKVFPTLHEGLQQAADDVGLITEIGVEYLHVGRIADAEARAQQALAITSDNVDSHVLMGEVRLRQGRIREARDHALIALAHNATDASALQLLCSVKFRRNPLLGLWWRSAVWLSKFDRQQIQQIGGAFSSVYLLVAGFFIMMGYPEPAILYVVVLGYVWGCRRLYARALRKELQSVQLRGEF